MPIHYPLDHSFFSSIAEDPEDNHANYRNSRKRSNLSWRQTSRPAVDYYEDQIGHWIILDMPGVKKGDISVELTKGNNLIISAKRKSSIETAEQKWHFRERETSSYYRSFQVAKSTHPDCVSATYCDGVLTVCIRKIMLPAQTTKIPVK